MVSFCCHNLQFNSRRCEPKVPEEMKSDAFLEYGPAGLWLLRDKEGGYRHAIFYCPWCGAKLPNATS